MTELTDQRLKELIMTHEINFQKHLLGLDSTGNLFHYCLEYIERLENQVREHERKKIFGKPRCLAIEDNGMQCKNIANSRIQYFGDPKIYIKSGIVTSVVVGFCTRHAKILKDAESNVNNLDENYHK